MRTERAIQMVSAHAEGENGHVITGGVGPVPGATLWEQRDFLHSDGMLRDLLLNEPRGHVSTHVNLLVPATQPEAQIGFLIMEPEHTPPMSGSNAICVATVCLETGILPMREPETRIMLEAPAGLVRVRARCEDGKVTACTLVNVPSFADRIDVPLEVEGHGTLTVSTAWGGDSYCIVDASALGLAVTPDEGAEMATLGARITAAANAQIGFHHPELDWSVISFCQFAGPLKRAEGEVTGRNAVVIDPGRLDRSPCGTGASARLALMIARGEVTPETAYRARSIVGGTFLARCEAVTEIAGRPAIVPSIRGQAWITGTHQIFLDPTDPWPRGYRVSDTWPTRPAS